MPYQITDKEFWKIQSCLERIYSELGYIRETMYGPEADSPATPAINQQLVPNPGVKDFKLKAPHVTSKAQDGIDTIDPVKISERKALADMTAAEIRARIPDKVLVSSVTGGSNMYYAMVVDDINWREATIDINEDAYEEYYEDLKTNLRNYIDITEEDKDMLDWTEMSEEQINETQARFNHTLGDE